MATDSLTCLCVSLDSTLWPSVLHIMVPNCAEAGEKERVAAWPVEGETVLDMYAGHGSHCSSTHFGSISFSQRFCNNVWLSGSFASL